MTSNSLKQIFDRSVFEDTDFEMKAAKPFKKYALGLYFKQHSMFWFLKLLTSIELQNIQKLSIACPYSKMFDYTIPNTKLSFLLKASI